MEAVAIVIRTIVILTLSTGPVFVDLDERMAPALAIQMAQEVARQDFEAIGAKVYYLPLPPLPEKLKNSPAKPLSIAEVSENWGDDVVYGEHVMVITTSGFKTLGELARAIEEAKPKATHIKRSVIITTKLYLEDKALGSLEAFGHVSEDRWNTMRDEERKAYVEVLEQCESLGIITVNWGGRKGRSFPTWQYGPRYSPGAARTVFFGPVGESELRLSAKLIKDFRAKEPELRPEEAARFQIAEILVEEGKYAEAVKELEAVLASTANEEVKNLARARISTIYAKMGLDEKSEGELKKIIESTTNLELKKRALITLAGIYRSQKRYDEAIVILRQVIELTQPDVMKLLQFRKEFMPGGFTLAAIDPEDLFTGNPGWLTQKGLKEVADVYEMALSFRPKRGYVCFFDKQGETSDDLYYMLLEFENDRSTRGGALFILDKIKKERSDNYFGVAFAASNVVILVSAERSEYIPAAKWLAITLLKVLPVDLRAKAEAKLQAESLRIAVARTEIHQKTAACKAELRAIGIALQAYAENYDGNLPDNLETLVAKKYVKPPVGRAAFTCPAKPKSPAPGYIYTPGLNTRMNRPDRIMLVHDKPGNHPGGVNVLFLDGHIEWVDLSKPEVTWKTLQRALEEKRWGVAALCFSPHPLTPHWAKFLEDVRKAARSTDEADMSKREELLMEIRIIALTSSEIREDRALLKLLSPEAGSGFAGMILRDGIWRIEFLGGEDELEDVRKWLGVEEAGREVVPPEAANEAAAIGALRSLMAAQEEFRFADIIDQDNDGAGEYGYFQELCATIAPAGHSKPILPGFFDPVFGVINASGAASKKYGYFFKVYLPGPAPAGPAVGETFGVNSATPNSDAINNREKRWVCYAWPMDYARTGRRTFVVNQAGNIFATAAMVATYDETAVMPGANAAFVMGTKNINGALADGVGVDGNTWHPVK